MRSIQTRLQTRLLSTSLATKILVPSLGLVFISLIVSILSFSFGTVQSQARLLERETNANANLVKTVLTQRVDSVQVAAGLLASDPKTSETMNIPDRGMALNALNQRVMAIRQRFELDLVQVYNQNGEAEANIVLSSLFQQSSLYDSITDNQPKIVIINNHLLLLSRAVIPTGGFVITGIDLQNELQRINKDEFIQDHLGLRYQNLAIGTTANLPFDQPTGLDHQQYVRQDSVLLAGMPVELLLYRPTADIQEITGAGLTIMVVNMLITTILLIIAAVLLVRAIAYPIRRLAQAAQSLAGGDLSQQVQLTKLDAPFGIGSNDEIGLLTQAFNHMTIELRNLYTGLEDKVQSRTQQIRAASEVARAASSSLDVKDVLQTSTKLISEQFGFYHAAVFTIAPDSQVAVLSEAYGASGETLMAHHHRLKIGSQSLVGKATVLGEAMIVQDVKQDEDYYANPFLPETRSEAVFPMLSGGKVIGAIDVQSNEPFAFTPDNISILITLTDQVAVALQNARLFEKQKADAIRLTEIDNLKSQFLENMSRELHAPLDTILNTSVTLLKGSNGPLTPSQFKSIQTINETGKNLSDMVDEILDMSKMDSGEINLKLETFSFKSLLESSFASAVTNAANKPEVTMLKTVEDDLPAVLGDRTRLHQVLIGLLSNAIEATQNGFVILRAQPVKLLDPNTNEMRSYIEVSISDTGPGIPPQNLEHIFEPFISTGVLVDGQSRALGLNMCWNVIQLHGGRIWAESTYGEGAIFTFVIPSQAEQNSSEKMIRSTQFTKREIHYA
jgi:signal transduction histidine kinase